MNEPDRDSHPAFFELPPEFADPSQAAVAIVPVPYDLTSSWKRGAAAGPEAIFDASQYVELYDIETGTEPYRRGIAALDPVECDGPPEQMAKVVAARVSDVLERGQLPVVLGGEHSVTIGAVRAVADHTPSLSVLQIDAHGDLRDSYHGSTHNHACVMARVRERCDIVQVGIRSIDTPELEVMESSRVFFAHEVVGNPDRTWMDRVADTLSDHVYITIDLDAFDPSVLPATGTPEPGGLSWYEVTELLKRVVARRKVVAFDIVELCPHEAHHASAFTAAKLLYRLIAMVLVRE